MIFDDLRCSQPATFTSLRRILPDDPVSFDRERFAIDPPIEGIDDHTVRVGDDVVRFNPAPEAAAGVDIVVDREALVHEWRLPPRIQHTAPDQRRCHHGTRSRARISRGEKHGRAANCVLTCNRYHPRGEESSCVSPSGG